MQRANLLDSLQNLQVVAALRSAMLISLQVFGPELVSVFLLSVQDEINFDWSKLLITIPESD